MPVPLFQASLCIEDSIINTSVLSAAAAVLAGISDINHRAKYWQRGFHSMFSLWQLDGKGHVMSGSELQFQFRPNPASQV